ncbi:MAG: purine-binding chemotaxis protein CheW [Agitococcus sp.]|jgi:twitching motility protein PilI|nr:purine-binding chemotaxis protein CheW [Moraxellaceae bacterium]MBP9215570.1 purine-binding chemotaxis protein CheW [Agitococcus sp.]MBK9186318.1 purine-binding chemotaxis protein CheW [Moraxellaceae bacterium]MBL0231579.1 purine-binding chemotaxis protein CheW [Moraxellaceae bacterium]MCC6374583.1 purine-binding chemotaxis protein CheW [Moraxellaceae bacterium]
MAARGFIKLLEIAERSKRRGLGLLGQGESAWTGVGFTLAGENFLAPIGEITEILKTPRYTLVPGVESWMRGLANVRGRLLPITDILLFLGRKSSKQEQKRRVLVVDHEEMFAGLVVDEVLGMQHFSTQDYSIDVKAPFTEITQFVQGAFIRDGQTWYVLLLSRFIEDPRFLKAAAA